MNSGELHVPRIPSGIFSCFLNSPRDSQELLQSRRDFESSKVHKVESQSKLRKKVWAFPEDFFQMSHNNRRHKFPRVISQVFPSVSKAPEKILSEISRNQNNNHKTTPEYEKDQRVSLAETARYVSKDTPSTDSASESSNKNWRDSLPHLPALCLNSELQKNTDSFSKLIRKIHIPSPERNRAKPAFLTTRTHSKRGTSLCDLQDLIFPPKIIEEFHQSLAEKLKQRQLEVIKQIHKRNLKQKNFFSKIPAPFELLGAQEDSFHPNYPGLDDEGYVTFK